MEPGRRTSEWMLAVVLLAVGWALTIGGWWAFRRSGDVSWQAVVLVAIGAGLMGVVFVAYAHGRSRVKSPRPYLPPRGSL